MKTILQKRLPPLGYALVLLFLVLGASPVLAAQESPAEKNILIFHEFSPDFPVHQTFNRGFLRGIEADESLQLSYAYEYLNMNRFPGDEAYLKATAEYLALKNRRSNWAPDLIVSSDGVAEFLSEYGKGIYGDVPIVSVWTGDNLRPVTISDRHTVISALANFDRNLKLIAETRKDAKRLYIVIGNSLGEQLSWGQLKTAAAAYADRFTFLYLNKLSTAEMLETLAEAGEDSAILFVRWVTDIEGKSFVPVRVLEKIIKTARAPVYGSQIQYLGLGIVGGYLYDQGKIGEQAARIALRALKGEETASLSLINDESHEYAFDWRALNRWNIDPLLLPENSRIENKKEDFWLAYGAYIALGITVILLETILIIALVNNRRRRRLAEEELVHLNSSLEHQVDQRTRELQEAKARLEDLNRQLDYSARVDALTGLYNRRHMLECLNKKHREFRRTGRIFSLMMADIDDFKHINDQHGHNVGDEALRHVARRMLEMVRDYDVVARWGGEEFLLLLPGLTQEDAAIRAEDLRSAIEIGAPLHDGMVLPITLTIGVAGIQAGEDIDSVIKRADDALYQGKSSGKNRIFIA